MIRMRPGHISVIILMLGSFVALMGCVATGVQPIDLSYVPAAPPEKADAEISKLTFGVAQFIDARSQKEFVAEIPWPAGKAQYKPSKPLGAIVAEAVGKRLEAAGLKVVQLGEIWNLELGSLKENWPDVVIGGRIDQFWATTNTDNTIHKVDADVSLHMVVATPRGKRALYEKGIIGRADDTRFVSYVSQVKSALNNTYSASVDEFFKDSLLMRQLRTVGR
ncbi:MAG TPA: hypothetical protein VJM80_09750 [bacterium]|nr:hypothetical protein [bacterium]